MASSAATRSSSAESDGVLLLKMPAVAATTPLAGGRGAPLVFPSDARSPRRARRVASRGSTGTIVAITSLPRRNTRGVRLCLTSSARRATSGNPETSTASYALVIVVHHLCSEDTGMQHGPPIGTLPAL